MRRQFRDDREEPRRPWSDPHWNAIDGIDPSLFFDADGPAWILNNGPPVGKPRYDGPPRDLDPALRPGTLKPFGARSVIVDGGVHLADKPIWIEGPHLFRKDGWYYLIAAEGGTAENHSEVVFRSRSVDRPLCCPARSTRS